MKRSCVQSLMLAAGLAVGVAAGTAAGQVPANDTCSGATAVVDGNNTLTNLNATLDTQAPCAIGGPSQSGADVWYTYTAPETGLRNFEITSFVRSGGAANGNSILTIYDACSGNMLACDDNGGLAALSKVRHFAVTAGTQYVIRFSNRGAAAIGVMGTAVLNISSPPAPAAGDDCQAAQPFSGSGSVGFTTAGKTHYDRRTWDCKDFRSDGWIAWTPATSGIAVVDACGAVGSSNLTLGVYDGCDNVPLICYNTSAGFNDPAPNGCGPKVCFDVVAGQTYQIRYGQLVASTTDPVSSGNLNFEVRAAGTGIAVPAGAVAEAGNCGDPVAADVNGGCSVTPFAFAQATLCQPYTGTISARLQPIISNQNIPGSFPDMLTVDQDWYQFTTNEDQTLTITGESEFWPRVQLMYGCPATQLAAYPSGSPNCQGVYTWSITTTVLPADTYAIRISAGSDNSATHQGVFDHDCSTNNRYWLKVTGSATVCPPASETCCRGTTCVVVPAGACAGTVDGTASVVVGSCTGNTQTGCCYGDYNHNGQLNIDDIFIYLNAWFASSPYTDVGGDGVSTPTIDDIFQFLNVWFAGCN